MECGVLLRATTDAVGAWSSEREAVLEHDPQLVLMLVTTSAGLTMFFTGIKKRRLRWRNEPRIRRRRKPRRLA
jgi:hypothetical protein